MENIYSNTIPIKSLCDEVEKILNIRYKLIASDLKNSITIIKDHISVLRDDLYVIIEHPYVDKTYRDTYYSYFASKKDNYPRNTIRLSFFSKKFNTLDFRNSENTCEIESNYYGFIVIRPTFPNVIGRSIIDPLAFNSNDIEICRVNYHSTANALKLNVSGFPHSSQDGEMITCAETTVWSIMEYFGTKYPEYTPVLPSKVNQVLGRFSFERLVPSKGLTAGQISFALRELGFGVKIYSANAYKQDFLKLLRTYVESGIPIVGVIQNDKGIGHALNIVGRKSIQQKDIDELNISTCLKNNVKVYDFADLDTEYVFIDDNYPPYRIANLKQPTSYYSNPRWAGCTITNFIVPLYPKTYLEAGEAKNISLSLIESLNIIKNKSIVVKTFLASSRSFKHEIALNKTFQNDAKELLISTPMPKFIWVTEISTKDLIKENKSEGLLILDATEPKKAGLIVGLLENYYLAINLNNIKQIKLSLQSFLNYKNNLK